MFNVGSKALATIQMVNLVICVYSFHINKASLLEEVCPSMDI